MNRIKHPIRLLALAFALAATGCQSTQQSPQNPEVVAMAQAGNRHASKFTATQAADFVTQWQVVESKSNTLTFTYNGAGVGKVNAGTLTDIITTFARQSANASGTEFTFGSALKYTAYGKLRGIFNGTRDYSALASLLIQAANEINALGYDAVVKTSGNGLALAVNEGAFTC